MLSASETELINNVVPAVNGASKDGRGYNLIQAFAQYADDREAEIERVCNTNHQEFNASVDQLLNVREGSITYTTDIIHLNQSIQSSTQKLAEQKKVLVESRGVQQNISEASQALKNCLEVLRITNQVHDLLSKKSHYAALKALDELQDAQLREVRQYKLADMIQRSAPMTKKLIADAVMADLYTWLFRIRETSQFLGEVAFYHVEQRRSRQKDRATKYEHLNGIKLNSAIELVSDESFEFDVLDNDDVQVDFTPLFECLHIHKALGQHDKFRIDYATTRRQQKELLIPASVSLMDPDDTSLSELLEGIAGFAIVEKATMKKVPELRSLADVCTDWKLLSRHHDQIANLIRSKSYGSQCANLQFDSFPSPYKKSRTQRCYSKSKASSLYLSRLWM